nr:hypothetical protein [Salinispora pacifica]
MTSLALTTSLGVGGAPAIGAVERAVTAADDRLGRPIRASTDNKDHEGKGGKDKGKGTPVRCGADALIAAITLANARGGAVLDLAEDCTYTLMGDIDDGAGLPAITTPITLNGGKHTTITRAAAADEFRILTVDAGGDLTLNHLTITGGQTTNAGTDGAGVFVDAGGTLTSSHSAITRNIAGGSGGGIANNGTTHIHASNVRHNTAASAAGGVASSGVLEISKSSIHANAAMDGGGVTSSGTVRIGHSRISSNRARGSGGGLFVMSGTGFVADSSVTANIAGDVVGGIIASVGVQMTIRSSVIAENVAEAGIVGGLGVDEDASVVVMDSIVKNNNGSGNGGGVYNIAELVLRNTKVFGNQSGDQGGGIYNEASATLTLFGAKVAKNIAVTDGGGIFNEVGGTVELNTATGTVVAKNRPNNCVNVTGCPD